MHPLDLVAAAPWRSAVFTTYALSLSFFEAVVLDRLVRGGARNALILADPEGIRAGLSEQGARRVGREYELEPIACATGVFHPKLNMFFGDQDAHLLVGSGNLTFGGWGVNLEAVEHLHPSFAGDAFDDAAELFELMAIDERLRSGMADQLNAIGAQLRRSAAGTERTGRLRLVHSVGGSISDQLAGYASELGGAERLTVVSPFFDTAGAAISRLAARIGCSDIGLHVHPTSVIRGLPGTNWPAGTAAQAVRVDEPFGADPRPLHAKCFEIMCRRGRLLVTGSANATRSALETGNIEASVVRIQTDTLVGWTRTRVSPPSEIIDAAEAEKEELGARVGILRATLEGDEIAGLVVVPRISGSARLSIAHTAGAKDLGEVTIDEQGRFKAVAPGLELQSWSGGRIVLRIEQGAVQAEGFVSVTAASEIIRRAGSLAPRLMAMMSGTETPADVAAIMSWFHENPNGLTPTAHAGGQQGDRQSHDPIWVPVEWLHSAREPQGAGSHQGTHALGSDRSMSLLRSAFSQPRGPWKTGTERDDRADSDDELEDAQQRLKRLEFEDRAKAQAVDAFGELLDVMLAPSHEGRHAPMAFALAHYLVDRNRPAPAKARNWAERIIADFRSLDAVADAHVITAALLLRATDRPEDGPFLARRFLLKLGLNPDDQKLDPDAIPGLIAVLGPDWNGDRFLEEVRLARTPGEQVASYLAAAETGGPLPDCSRLRASKHWGKLVKGLTHPETRQRFRVFDSRPTSCPECHTKLPRAAIEELMSHGVTGCCRLILSKEI